MIILTIIMFIINIILLNIFNNNYPILMLILINLYPLFYKKNKYMIYIIIIGIISDYLFSDLFLFNVLSFMLLYPFIIYINNILRNKYLIFIINLLVSIFTYQILSYISSIIFFKVSFNINILITNLFKTIIINLLIGLVLIFINDLKRNKKGYNLHIISR